MINARNRGLHATAAETDAKRTAAFTISKPQAELLMLGREADARIAT